MKNSKNNSNFVFANDRIRNSVVRIVGDINPTNEITIADALSIAKEQETDLILISETNDNIGICKLMSMNKFLYERKKKEQDNKKKQKLNQVNIKEIRLTPHIDSHDFDFKLNHAIKFLQDNNKVKVTMFFKGREIVYKDDGEVTILKFVESLSEHGVAESLPKLEGKRMSMFVKPKK